MEAEVGTMACDLKYSGAAARLIAAAALASLALAALLPLALALRVALAAGIASLAMEALERVAWHRGPRGVRSFAISGAGEIAVETAQGRRCDGRLCDGSFVAPWLTLVRWRRRGERFDRTVMVLPDMLDAESFRRLRVRLRWG
jgi:toxin CptA